MRHDDQRGCATDQTRIKALNREGVKNAKQVSEKVFLLPMRAGPSLVIARRRRSNLAVEHLHPSRLSGALSARHPAIPVQWDDSGVKHIKH